MVRVRLRPRTPLGATSVLRTHLDHRRRTITAAVAIIAVTTAILAIEESWNRLNPEPYHTSVLSGQQWVQELLDGHRDRMRASLGTPAAVFEQLEQDLIRHGGLTPRRYFGTSEEFLERATGGAGGRRAERTRDGRGERDSIAWRGRYAGGKGSRLSWEGWEARRGGSDGSQRQTRKVNGPYVSALYTKTKFLTETAENYNAT